MFKKNPMVQSELRVTNAEKTQRTGINDIKNEIRKELEIVAHFHNTDNEISLFCLTMDQ